MSISLEHLNELDDIRMIYFRQNCHLIVRQLSKFWNTFEFL